MGLFCLTDICKYAKILIKQGGLMRLINSIQANHPNYSFSFYGAERLILHDRYGTVYIRSALRKK